MNIKSANINDFTVFDDFELNLSSGINMVIEKNGTGKSILLRQIQKIL